MSSNPLSEITARLSHHVAGTQNADDPTVLSDYVWMLKRGRMVPGIKQLWESLARDFNALNNELKRDSTGTCFTRPLLYAVSGLMTKCFNFAVSSQVNEATRREILELGWRITAAWDAVLAGDIDDISAFVDLEGKARSIIE